MKIVIYLTMLTILVSCDNEVPVSRLEFEQNEQKLLECHMESNAFKSQLIYYQERTAYLASQQCLVSFKPSKKERIGCKKLLDHMDREGYKLSRATWNFCKSL